MSGAGPRYDALLATGDPRPFVLIECERDESGAEPRYGFSVSWGDQIDDEDVERVIVAALATMIGVSPDLFLRVIEKGVEAWT